MVTRVDKKPIIYNTTLLRALRPSVITEKEKISRILLGKAVGHAIPPMDARLISESYEDLMLGFRVFGTDDPYSLGRFSVPDEEENEAIRIARTFMRGGRSVRQIIRDQNLMEAVSDVQRILSNDVVRIYYGTEAIYQLLADCNDGHIFPPSKVPNYATWATQTAKEIMMAQSTSMFLHPSATRVCANALVTNTNYLIWEAWNNYKRLETIALRVTSRKGFLAHSHYAGRLRKPFDPAEKIEDDFELPWTGYAEVKDGVKGYLLMGLKYIKVANKMYVLSHDDCVNLATMAQCQFRAQVYFGSSNGYPDSAVRTVRALIRDMVAHCCKLIDAGKNFSNFIRSIHILSQKEFNDAYEDEAGAGFGWEERSDNYDSEAMSLDESCHSFFDRACALAINKMDRLNTCFIYHTLIGDEMIVADLVSKVRDMEKKVMPADKDEWARFIRFSKAYLLCRFMYTYKRKPKLGGDVALLNSQWADACLQGNFRMPPQADWGKVWIQGEYRYTEFADTWHLECQDVAYVMKDSEGMAKGKYASVPESHSELLMAMKHGKTLNPLTMTDAEYARARIKSGIQAKEVVLTCAPKAENAKPSWKKRVTFAADCEFRKMQAEVDRNCRRAMAFIRGPSLGVDQCILEKQFADIANTTVQSAGGVICSHDISAWSESMDRHRKFQFESILLNMFDQPEMINISRDWDKIAAVVTKQGCQDIIGITNGSFQGFDGSSSTILHSLILIYCIDTARRAGIIDSSVKANMATLIDDCVALMTDLIKTEPANAFWAHLKDMYLKLGFVIDDLKSIFSDIKAIYLSRRFILGGEVPSDLKIFVKAHSSYEDPLRNTLDLVQDIFGGLRGAVDANGDVWFTYYNACLSVLSEIAHNHSIVQNIPPAAAAWFALAPTNENGWGFPTIPSWCTNDVVDKLNHYNSLIENCAVHMCNDISWTAGIDVMPQVAIKAINAIKNQPWREVTHANIFTSPFETLRDGPIKPSMIRRNAVQDILTSHATAPPWSSLLGWNTNATTEKVRELLINSGPLHAPTLAAMVNCMPDNYRLSLIGKASGSTSVFEMLPPGERMLLKRRIHRAASNYFDFSYSIYASSNMVMTVPDYASLTHLERTRMERDGFYSANGVTMTDHTFPDPVATFSTTAADTRAEICPNASGLRAYDRAAPAPTKASHYVSFKGMFIPRRSGRVWEVTSEHAKGWDTVSQRIAMGLAILARAKADGHKVNGLLCYFTKAWNEFSTITPESTNLIAIHGSIKRLDANPGSATHPVIINRNILSGINVHLKPALDSIAGVCKEETGNTSHLHDMLAHESAMLAVTAAVFALFTRIGLEIGNLKYKVCVRRSGVCAEDVRRMDTDKVTNAIELTIMDGEDNYGLLQACPDLICDIAIPTMTSSWVMMINALVGRDMSEIERLRKELCAATFFDAMTMLREATSEYSPAVILAAPPTDRGHINEPDLTRLTLIAPNPDARTSGDNYTVSVRPMTSKFTRELIISKSPEVISAITIRSIIWDRFKDGNIRKLAKILYDDPDKDLSTLDRCKREDFWRASVAEIHRNSKGKLLSDLTMSAFRNLGIKGIHIATTNEVADVVRSVASYFGAHLREVCTIIQDRIVQIAGRRGADFERPIMERVITSSPGVVNARMRQKHMLRLVKYNIDSYKDRLRDIEKGAVKHRGDARGVLTDRAGRIDDLWSRLNVYMNIGVYNKGELCRKWKSMIVGAINEAAARVGAAASDVVDIKRILGVASAKSQTMVSDAGDRVIADSDDTDAQVFLACFNRILAFFTAKGAAPFWDPGACEIGAKMALAQLDIDEGNVGRTMFAVSPADFAPRLFKRVIHTEAGIPVPVNLLPAEEVVQDAVPEISLDDLEALLGGDTFCGSTNLGVEYWKALYTLLLAGRYDAADVNAKLGTSIAAQPTCASLREAHLEDFSDDTLKAAFKGLATDYFAEGIIFEEEWLSRDEADAYTTDELAKFSGAFLF